MEQGRDDRTATFAPIIEHKDHESSPVFRPENLLREARRQRGLPPGTVPPVCVLDPDGDMVRHLAGASRLRVSPSWACYHSTLYEADLDGLSIGLLGCAVGGPYAVLVAEQLFVSGCEFLVSVTSAGQLAPAGGTPYYVLIEGAIRDEGTSYHYLPPSRTVEADAGVVALGASATAGWREPVYRGTVWTTDAPYRETAGRISELAREGVLAVEMEAASLYALARARGYPILCFAHVTNRMAVREGDFEKGDAAGAPGSLALVHAVGMAWVGRDGR
ncbi:MAG: nucleoside phosphorylase [Gemmatimonadales bacterium]|nr:nucleoside phosphorylase [Gemmatimonadales bacterium]